MIHKGESVENYLEMILMLNQQMPSVRSIDIVRESGYTKPSVSIAMKNLRQKELITMDEDGYIKLTERGRQIAESVYERHTTLTILLTSLGVNAETAAEDACKIENVISEETFAALKSHMNTYVK